MTTKPTIKYIKRCAPKIINPNLSTHPKICGPIICLRYLSHEGGIVSLHFETV